jgi:uncharacterized membrane protein YhaH (DUF805 family)
MAIKDQCSNCKHSTSIDSCAIKGINIIYDGISCANYTKNDIDLRQQDEDNTLQSNPANINVIPSGSKKRMFQHSFSFKGRIRRTEYCLSYLVYFIYSLPMEIINENDLNENFALFWLMLLIPMIWFLLAQGAKRCHDRDNSGWYQIIPFYGLWMLFAEGDSGINSYGEPPK